MIGLVAAVIIPIFQVNLAIEDGLRYLWTTQTSRAANFPTSPTTRWSNQWHSSEAALVTLAFENQGYRLPANPATPIMRAFRSYHGSSVA